MNFEKDSKAYFESFEFKDLHFGYEGGKELFDHASAKLPAYENVLIDGNSGAGKSALLKIMAGIVQPTAGSFFINDRNLVEMSFEDFLPWRLKIGYSFEYGGLLSNRTVSENLMLPLLYHKICHYKEAERRVEYHLETFKLTEAADLRPSATSGGMRKATVVARSLIMHPELLLLDNPTTGLNKEVIDNLAAEIESRQESGGLKHVFIVSDDVRFLSSLVTKRVEIRNRKIIFEEHEAINELLSVGSKKVVGQ